MLKTKSEIENWLNKYRINNYKIQADLTVNVNGDVNLTNQKLKEIPVKFGKVKGNFDCSKNHLKNLDFAPEIVNGNFYCSYNRLVSLENCPKIIQGNFYCYSNNILKIGLTYFNSETSGIIASDFGSNEIFLNEVKKQKSLKEKTELENTLNTYENIQSNKKRL